MDDVAFKPYACGTMTQPFIDCAIRLADDGVRADDVARDRVRGRRGHGPPSVGAARRQAPAADAVCREVQHAVLHRRRVLRSQGRASAQFVESRIRDERVLALASKIRYRINHADEYPRKFSGHVRAELADGTMREFRQPHMRGGAHAPLTAEEIEAKFMDNARYGGWDAAQATRFLDLSRDDLLCATARRRRRSSGRDVGNELSGCVAVVTGSARNIGRVHRAGARRRPGAARDRERAPQRAGGRSGRRRRSAAEADAPQLKLADVGDPEAAAALIAAAVDALRPARHSREQRQRSTRDRFRPARISGVARDPGRHAGWRIPVQPRGAAATDRGGPRRCREHRRPVGTHRRCRRAHVVAAKAGLVGLTRALAHDLAPNAITVNCVAPGVIDTVRDRGSTARCARASRRATCR